MKRFLTNSRRFFAAWMPGRPGMLTSIAAITLVVGYVTSNQQGMGAARGRAFLRSTGAGLSGASIHFRYMGADDPDAERPRARRVTTGPDGRFQLSGLPEGLYSITGESNAHEIVETFLTIEDGKTSDIELPMYRSKSSLELSQRQRTYATSESARIAIRGYEDSGKAHGQDSVHIDIYRTRLSDVLRNEKSEEALQSVGNRWAEAAPGLPNILVHPSAGPEPALIERKDVRIDSADREGFFFKRIDFGKLRPGLYLIDISHFDSSAPIKDKDQIEYNERSNPKYREARPATKKLAAWVLVTDTALITKKAGSKILAFAVDMKTGSPLPGCQLIAFRSSKIAAEAVCDSRGLANLTVPANTEEKRLTIVARRGEDEAVIGQSEYERSDQGAFAVHLYTERPVYRPGQRIYYKGIIRRALERGFKYSVPSGEPVTIEVHDPQGDAIHTEKKVANRYGSFSGHVDLNSESPSGSYTLICKVRGETFSEDVQVASYHKPEYSVTVKPANDRYSRGDDVEMTISASYYFGAPVAGAKVSYSVYRSADWIREEDEGQERVVSEEESDEEREAPRRSYDRHEYYGETNVSGEARLDENGKAVVRFKADVPDSPNQPQRWKYTLTANVSDESNREAGGQGDATVTSGDIWLRLDPAGYLAEPGKPITLTLKAGLQTPTPQPPKGGAAASGDAASSVPTSGLANLAVELKTRYEKWSSGQYKQIPVEARNLRTGPDGTLSIDVVPPRSGEFEIVVRAYDQKGRAVYDRQTLWVSSDRGEDLETEYADLSVVTDKKSYKPGDTARALINAARTGQTVLVTVEGERIYEVQQVVMNGRSAVVKVPIRPEYGPNIFLSACYVRDKKFASSQAALRVRVAARDIKVEIAAERPRTSTSTSTIAFHPGDPVTYHIRTADASGRPAACEVSLGVVDESIYALREDDPTALRRAFYPKRNNRVSTRYSFEVENLGDANKSEPVIEARKRFEDVAYWNPSIDVGPTGNASVSFRLPDNLTEWRATATAHTMDTALGRTTDNFTVSKEFFVRLETPRFFTQRDSSRVLAMIHNQTGARQTAIVRIRTENLTIQGDNTQTLTLEPGAVGQASWNVDVAGLEQAKISVNAWTPKIEGATQWTDGIEWKVPIRAHGRLQFENYAGELTAAKPETEIVRLDPNAVLPESRLTIRITPSVESALSGALDYLVGYPYGCTEQTLSRFVPDLLVERLIRSGRLPGESGRLAELPKMVRDGLQRLYRFQHGTGGWGWWEHDEDNAWMTAYALYGLAIAKQGGYPVREKAITRGIDAALKVLPKEPHNRAFALYAIALAGGKKQAGDKRGTIELRNATSDTLAYTILLNREIGNPAQPAGLSTATLVERLNRLSTSDGPAVRWDPPASSWDWSSRSETAVAIRALIAASALTPGPSPNAGRGENGGRILGGLRWLMAHRTGEYWESTRDTSLVLVALVDYLQTQPPASSGGEIRLTLNERPLETYSLTSDVVRRGEITLRVPPDRIRPGKNEVQLVRVGTGSPVFYGVQLRQTIGSEDMGSASGSAGVTVEREYMRVTSGQSGDSWSLKTEPSGNKLKAGDRIRVRLTIKAPREMSYVLIEDAFPSGCEATERGTADEEIVGEWNHWWSNVDIRDDRIAYFVRDLKPGWHVIEYNLRAQTPGKLHVLPAVVEPMYQPELRAESAESRLEITR